MSDAAEHGAVELVDEIPASAEPLVTITGKDGQTRIVSQETIHESNRESLRCIFAVLSQILR